jgi:hypothetical protein
MSWDPNAIVRSWMADAYEFIGQDSCVFTIDGTAHTVNVIRRNHTTKVDWDSQKEDVEHGIKLHVILPVGVTMPEKDRDTFVIDSVTWNVGEVASSVPGANVITVTGIRKDLKRVRLNG